MHFLWQGTYSKSFKRISFKQFSEIDAPTFEIAFTIFKRGDEYKSKSVAPGILSFFGLTNYREVISYFEFAAADDNWDIREIA